ncbi:hypothetical protein [Pectobacterium brasiliense]|uniref:hypothetical protein n=1 Tax=Pectobacterium brasiliense TaxID=180957 RepID=UPI0004E77966|nr:hypothetical protein [Pectobacterium brasiliense]KFF70083.1 hypothetical protein IW00_04760 [Pectobacterium brasiliense]
MSKNIACMGDFGGNNPEAAVLENLLKEALQPLDIEALSVTEGRQNIAIFIGEVDDDKVESVHQAIESVITSLGGQYQYPDNDK